MKNWIAAVSAAFMVSACGQGEAVPSASEAGAAAEARGSAAASSPAEEALEALANEPSLPWLKIVQSEYPEDFKQIVRDMDDVLQRAQTEADGQRMMAQKIMGFMQERKVYARSAPAPYLMDWLDLNIASLKTLQAESVEACNAIPKGQLRPGISLSKNAWKSLADTTAQLLRAAKAAEATPVSRDGAKANEADWLSWRDAMVDLGATQADLVAIARKEPMSAERECQVRIMMMEAASGLPPEAAIRILLPIIG